MTIESGQPTTTRHMIKQMLALAIPIMIGGGVQTSYHLINAFWVGRLGAEAVAVVALCFPINLLMISIGSGISLAGSILVAQHHGARNVPARNHAAAQTLTTAAILATLLALLGYMLAPKILSVMASSNAIPEGALSYLRITFFGAVFLFLGSVYQSILRGVGDAKAPLRVIGASVVINAVLDPLFIFGVGPFPALGVEGAAYATLLTQLIAATVGIRLMLQPRFGLQFPLKELCPDLKIMSTLIRVGLPASIEQSMQALTVSVMTVLAVKFGTVVLAAYGIAFRVLTFTMMPTFSISMATSILVGQSTGARDENASRRIANTAILASMVVMATMAAVIFIIAPALIRFFVPDDEALIEHGGTILRILALSFPLSGIQMALTGAFRGAGKTFTAMLLTLTGIWGIQIPLAYLLSQHTALGVNGLWWSSVIASAINILISLSYFKFAHWTKTTLTDDKMSAAHKRPNQ